MFRKDLKAKTQYLGSVNPKTKRIVITGGHHTSAIPVIKEIWRRNANVEIYWFGHKYSMKGDKNTTLEFRQITSLGISFFALQAGKVYKTYNIFRLVKVPLGFLHAFILLMQIKPNLILSFGGYLAVPVVIAGYILKIPSITHEQTMVTGYANKVISKFARRIMLSWVESEKYYPKNKTVLTGIPLRKEIFVSSSNNFEVNKQLPTVYVTAGKTGSHKINLLIKESLPKLLDMANIIHQCGDHSYYKDFDILLEEAKKYKNKSGKYLPVKFVLDDVIGEVFSLSKLIISRAGAHTISEIVALEKPSLLIPIPWVSHNEQVINAGLVKSAGLGEIIEEKQLSVELFIRKVEQMLLKIDNYKIKDKSFGVIRDAEIKITDIVFKYL
ncbi:MAG: hypothetical protein ACD_24C00494G0005 [uncultured bacterium]|uniref:UDP-N-acetylglucosamine--N-acetylmuramyl-(pentapeptide) pyrophosphoryl-undecaprenol N-acetylglucosamine transferase n=1 Tax=candidate division WWE3 bacterium RBG_16_37_10 TaxID=1802610 RepID=A0A1F4V339_UNCKA|nr:MAG: hypothetical protein ACD_24C00494G0005 [uncultured bacterium]OGC51572.1 MAG: hypothetical protein A2W32_03910 [candidate division WWE3 bacterium RBG_16_37_10]